MKVAWVDQQVRCMFCTHCFFLPPAVSPAACASAKLLCVDRAQAYADSVPGPNAGSDLSEEFAGATFSILADGSVVDCFLIGSVAVALTMTAKFLFFRPTVYFKNKHS